MRKVKSIFTLCLCLIMVILTVGSMTAMGAPAIEAEAYFSAENDGFIVEGTVTDTDVDSVSIFIYRPDFTIEMVEAGTATINEALCNATVERLAKGEFKYTCKASADDDKGYYTVYINYGGSELEVIENVYYATPTDVAIALEIINSITGTPSEKLEAFNEASDYFGKLPEAFEMLNESQQAEVVDETTQKTDYTSITEFIDAIEANSVNKLILHPLSKETVKYVVENHNDLVGFDLSNRFYKKYVEGHSDRVDAVYEYTVSLAPFDTTAEAKNAFQKGVIVQSLRNSGAKGEIYNNLVNDIGILNDKTNIELLSGINITGFKNLTDVKQEKMLTAFYEANKHIVNTCEEFVKNWNAAVKSAGSSSGEGSGGPSGGPGGGPITNNPSGITESGPGNTGISGNPSDDDKNDDTPVFSDIGSVPWAEESITALYKAGIINGKDESNFAPNDYITREEFLKMILLCANVTVNDNAQTTFIDVNKGDWYYEIIASAQGQGLVNGVSNVRFGVGENITRQDMSVMIVRLISSLGMELDLSSDNSKFTDDAEIASYASVSVYTMKRAGIINGYEDGSFEPNAYATRAEAAKITYALCSLMVD